MLLDTVVGWGLASARSKLTGTARRAGLPERRVTDLIIAVNEIITNALVHGGGDARLRVVTGDGALVCEVLDHGEGFDPAHVSTGPPDVRADPEHGMGLWIVRTLCDDVEVDRVRAGARVRMIFHA